MLLLLGERIFFNFLHFRIVSVPKEGIVERAFRLSSGKACSISRV